MLVSMFVWALVCSRKANKRRPRKQQALGSDLYMLKYQSCALRGHRVHGYIKLCECFQTVHFNMWSSEAYPLG